MDLPPPPPTAAVHHHLQDTLESSSPTCWDNTTTTLPPPKLRLMCSFGGHIIPRPHDRSLCYMGGETRIVVADRHTSLSDLCSRLSTTLLNGRHFSLKYQLPTEDLDSLVSVTTDEDLDNMIEEYDRLNNSTSVNQIAGSKPFRLRLFLFLSKPETAASMGSLLDDAKSETWFVDALNGAGLLPRGLSDSATIDNLLEHKDGVVTGVMIGEGVGVGVGEVVVQDQEKDRNSDVGLDYSVVETTTMSSFGSSSSSPSMSNLPPIRVKVSDQMAGLDEQLSQLNVGVGPPGWAGYAATFEDERSADHGGMRKPPLPTLQPVQRRFGNDGYSLPSPESKQHGGGYGLHSPDSMASDSSSIASGNCQQKTTFTQDPNTTPSNRETQTPPAPTMITYQQQIPDTQPKQQQQQMMYQPPPHFIQHQTPQPVSSYPIYAQPPPPQQQIDNQQYPLYFLPVTKPPPDHMVTNNSPAYGTTNGTPAMIQVPTNNQYVQYMNVSQIPHPMAPAAGGKYGYDHYVHPPQDHMYYSQHQSVAAAPLPSPYQTMTPASAMLLTTQTPQQQPTPENGK